LSGIIQAVNLMGGCQKLIQTGTPINLRSGYYTPGFLTVLTAHLRRYHVPKSGLTFVDEQNSGYFSAMGLAKVLWGEDDYQFNRSNAGTNYAPLTHLSSRDAVDDATQQINSCLRQMAASSDNFDYRESAAFRELMHVVGELHDNVWSHGLDCGFSAAQRRVVLNNTEIEFALADTGVGFLEELRSSGIAATNGIFTDQQAIEWCIQEGNSSKLVDHEDEWGQSVPDDFVGGNPFGRKVKTRRVPGGNHHQGLGLAKLMQLAKAYDGLLYLVSGNSCLCLKSGIISFPKLSKPWKGVAVSLTLQEAKMAAAEEPETTADINDLMNLLRG